MNDSKIELSLHEMAALRSLAVDKYITAGAISSQNSTGAASKPIPGVQAYETLCQLGMCYKTTHEIDDQGAIVPLPLDKVGITITNFGKQTARLVHFAFEQKLRQAVKSAAGEKEPSACRILRNFVPEVLCGDKTATIVRDLPVGLTPNSQFNFVEAESGEALGYATCTNITEIKLKVLWKPYTIAELTMHWLTGPKFDRSYGGYMSMGLETLARQCGCIAEEDLRWRFLFHYIQDNLATPLVRQEEPQYLMLYIIEWRDFVSPQGLRGAQPWKPLNITLSPSEMAGLRALYKNTVSYVDIPSRNKPRMFEDTIIGMPHYKKLQAKGLCTIVETGDAASSYIGITDLGRQACKRLPLVHSSCIGGIKL